MKKNSFCFSPILCLWLLSIIFLGACSSQPEAITVIPKNAHFVTIIDVPALIQKGKLYDLSNLKVVKKFKDEIEKESKDGAKIMKDLMEDPGASGVNFAKDAFVFSTMKDFGDQFYCFAAEISDEDDFKTFLKKASKVAEIDIEVVHVTNYDYRYATLGSQAAVAWDDDKMLFVSSESFSSKNAALTELKRLFKIEENISQLEPFKKFLADKKDISFWLASDFLPGFILSGIKGESGVDFKNSHISEHIEFRDGELSLLTQIDIPSLAKEIKENKVFDQSFNTELLKFFPAQYYVVAGGSVNMDGYKKLMLNQSQLKGYQEDFYSKTGIDLTHIFETLAGSMAFSLFEFDKREITYSEYEMKSSPDGGFGFEVVEKTRETIVPIMGLAADIKNKDWILDLTQKIPDSFLEKKEGYYAVTIPGQSDVFLAYDNEFIFVTNDQKRIQSFGKTNGKSLQDTPVKEQLLENHGYGHIRLNFEEYPPMVQDELRSILGKAVIQGITIFNSISQELEFKQANDYSFEIIFKTQHQENCLQTIITSLDEQLSSFQAI